MDRRRLTVDSRKTALLVVDFQERLARAMPPETYARAERAVSLLVRAASILDIPIVVTEQYPAGLGATSAPILDLLGDRPRISKLEFSAGRVPEVLDRLFERKAESALVCGMEAHVCVYQTVVDLLDHGFFVHLARDAVASRRDSDRDAALEMARDAGAAVSTAEAIVFQLLGRAGTPAFKALAPYLKDK